MKAGQELARIDTTDVELALRQARAERDQAAAELRLRLAGRAAGGHRRAGGAGGERRAPTSRAPSATSTRMQGLLDRGSGTTKARDDARTRRDMAAARLAAGEAGPGAGCRPGSRAEEIDAARARVAAVEARIAQLEQQIEDATVTSPLDGRRDREDRRAGRAAPGRLAASASSPTSPTPGSRSTWPSPTSAASASARRPRS